MQFIHSNVDVWGSAAHTKTFGAEMLWSILPWPAVVSEGVRCISCVIPALLTKAQLGCYYAGLMVFMPGPKHSVFCQNPSSRAITTTTCLIDLNLMLQSPSEILENMDLWYCNSISNKLCPKHKKGVYFKIHAPS